MKKRMLNKIRSQSGESIAETLIALLISALAMLMLAGAVSSASRVVTTSKQAMTDYYEADAAIAAKGSSGSAMTVIISASGEYSAEYPCKYSTNASFAATPVYVYHKGGTP